jgi:uncharacterized protein involved in exopolysaccharide biosynthesis
MRFVLALAGVVALSGTALASETVTYTYDAQGRVVKVEHDNGPADGVTTEYTYDDADNRTRKKKTGA